MAQLIYSLTAPVYDHPVAGLSTVFHSLLPCSMPFSQQSVTVKYFTHTHKLKALYITPAPPTFCKWCFSLPASLPAYPSLYLPIVPPSSPSPLQTTAASLLNTKAGRLWLHYRPRVRTLPLVVVLGCALSPNNFSNVILTLLRANVYWVWMLYQALH